MILVTGGAGYIGSHVVELLQQQKKEFMVVDDLSTGAAFAVPEENLHIGDFGDKSWIRNLIQRHGVNSVLHLAAQTSVPDSIEKPLYYYQENVEKTIGFLNICVEQKIKNFIFSSSAAVYGNAQQEQITEDTPLLPINPYGQSKKIIEDILADIKNYYSLNYISLRYFNVAGASFEGHLGQTNPTASHLVKMLCKVATGQLAALPIFGNDYPTPDGSCIRDYIHVVDLADAHLAALSYLENGGSSSVLNCGYGHGFSVFEMVSAFEEILEAKLPLKILGRRHGDPTKLIADNRKLIQTLNWTPKHDNLHAILKSAYHFEQKLMSGKMTYH